MAGRTHAPFAKLQRSIDRSLLRDDAVFEVSRVAISEDSWGLGGYLELMSQ